MTKLTVTNLKKQYKHKTVVYDVSLEVNKGQIVGLLGPNGAGKTTCFYMIVGLIKPDFGSVYMGKTELTQLPMHTRAKQGLGYLPQEPSIFRKLTVADNLLAILETQIHLNKKERTIKMEQLLQEFNIDHLHSSMGVSLSGGERRRVEIARALTTDPDVILLDEPFAGVDPISISDIKSIIQQLKYKGIGVLITDHNVRETLDICEHAYIVNAGQVISEGDSQHIMNDIQVQKVYLGHQFRL